MPKRSGDGTSDGDDVNDGCECDCASSNMDDIKDGCDLDCASGSIEVDDVAGGTIGLERLGLVIVLQSMQQTPPRLITQ